MLPAGSKRRSDHRGPGAARVPRGRRRAEPARPLLRPGVQRRAEPLLSEATVDGDPPATPELLDVVIAALEGRQAVDELVSAWAAADVELTETPALDGMVAQLAGLYTRLAQVAPRCAPSPRPRACSAERVSRVPLTSPEEWITYRSALETVRVRRRASTAWAAPRVAAPGRRPPDPAGRRAPELTAAAAALSARDLPAYERLVADVQHVRVGGQQLLIDQETDQRSADRLGIAAADHFRKAARRPGSRSAWRRRSARCADRPPIDRAIGGRLALSRVILALRWDRLRGRHGQARSLLPRRGSTGRRSLSQLEVGDQPAPARPSRERLRLRTSR